MQSMEVIKANKYHFEKQFKFKDFNKNSISLENSRGIKIFLPKSEVKVFQLTGGDVELHIPEWLYKKEKEFLC